MGVAGGVATDGLRVAAGVGTEGLRVAAGVGTEGLAVADGKAATALGVGGNVRTAVAVATGLGWRIGVTVGFRGVMVGATPPQPSNVAIATMAKTKTNGLISSTSFLVRSRDEAALLIAYIALGQSASSIAAC